MARRNGRKGDYLYTSDYTGVAGYASRMQKDYWNDYNDGKILQRNLQEIATPLNDPYPVPMYNGPDYEKGVECASEIIPLFIGRTTRRTPTGTTTIQALGVDPGVGQMSIGCTFIVR